MPRPHHHNKRASGAFKRAALVVVAGVAAAVAIHSVRQARTPDRPPEPARLDRMSQRTLAAHVSVTGPVGAARAAEQWAAEQSPPPVQAITAVATAPVAPPKPTGVARVTGVRSRGPHPDPEQAKRDAAELAAVELNRQLRLEFDVSAELTPADVLARHVRPASVKVETVDEPSRKELKDHGVTGDQFFLVTLDAEVTPAQVRQLRADGRSWLAARGVGMVLVCLGAVLAFLKLDGATKGYLSWGLGLGFAGAAVGGIAGLAFLL